MIGFIVFDIDTGRIKRTGRVSDPHDLPLQARKDRGEDWTITEGKVDGRLYCIADGGLRERPEIGAPETVDAEVGKAVELNVPKGSRIRRGGVEIGVADGPVSFVPEAAGVTEIRIDPPFPYRRHTVVVTAGRSELADRRAARQEAARRSFRGLG